MADELLINVRTEGERELDQTTKKVEGLGKAGNKTQTELQRLRKELLAQKAAMLQAEEGTEEYGRALAKASQIQQKVADVNKQVRAGMMGVGEMASSVARITSGMAGGFSALTGTLQLFGVENEEVIKSIQKLQAVMAIATGLSAFANSIDAMKEFSMSIQASINMQEGLQDVTSKTGKSFAQAGVEVGVLSGAVGSVGNKIDQVSTEVGGLNKATLEAIKTGRDLSKEQSEAISAHLKNLQMEGTSITKQTVSQSKFNITLTKTRAIVKGLSKAFVGLIKTMGPMIGMALVLGGIVWGIEKLIRAITKIPESIKLKIELEENIFSEITKAEERIAQIKHNIQKASTKQQLDEIKERLVQEGILTEEKAKEITDLKSELNSNFWSDYIKGVKDVAENEFKIRKDVELRLQKELKESQLRQVVSERNKEGGIGLSFEIRKRRKELKELEREIKTFQSTFYKDGELSLNDTLFDFGGKSSTAPSIPDSLEGSQPPFQMEGLYQWLARLEERARALKALGGIMSPVAVDVDKIVNQAEDNLRSTLDNILRSTPESFRSTKVKSPEEIRREWEEKWMVYQDMLYSIGTISDSIIGMYDARMTAIDNYFDEERRLIEQSVSSEEWKNQRLLQLDEERYLQQSKMLEQQKKWRKATIWMDWANGVMGSYARATRLDAPPSPLNWIAAGLETAALTGQAIAQSKNIDAQRIQKPNITSSSPSSSNLNVAMSPSRTSMESREEVLNKIERKIEEGIYEVRVSDINKTQARVRVREVNSTF